MKGEQGFIAIVALAMFLLLSIFGIIVQTVTTNTVNNVRDTNAYYEASDLADSMMEYLQYELEEREAGYNTEVECAYEQGGTSTSNGGNYDPICDEVLGWVGLLDHGMAVKDVKISMEIKGRSKEWEKFESGCPGISGDCYVVPLPGTGDAGERCNLYEPFESTDALASIDHNGQLGGTGDGVEGISQIDYSCNWGKLSFGSSLTDRIAIPLYYDEGISEMVNVINPFHEEVTTGDRAENFILRVRTPCKPCEEWLSDPEQCSGRDPTICRDEYSGPTDRYVLDDLESNDVVVQWQISGECKKNPGCVDGGDCEMEACGLIQVVDENASENSAIFESVINTGIYKKVLDKFKQGIDITNYAAETLPKIEDQLQKTEKPVLTLFLGEKLIDEDVNNVPYLEYQLLTDKPIGNAKTYIQVNINIQGNVFTKELHKQEQKDLIDFAVQN